MIRIKKKSLTSASLHQIIVISLIKERIPCGETFGDVVLAFAILKQDTALKRKRPLRKPVILCSLVIFN